MKNCDCFGIKLIDYKILVKEGGDLNEIILVLSSSLKEY